MRRIFDDKSVDIVSIATPNHWHSLAAIWAMQAGKDVYVEKPVSHNISEGRRMVQVARKYNRICQGGTQYRSTGANRAAAQYIREGKLGQIKLAHVCTYRLADLDRSGGPVLAAADGGLQPLGRPGADGTARPAQALPLRLALVLGLGRRRTGQQQRPCGGRDAHGPGPQGAGPGRAQLRRPRGPGRLRRDAQRAGHHPRFRPHHRRPGGPQPQDRRPRSAARR